MPPPLETPSAGPRRRRWLVLAALVAFAALVRAPFWIEALHLPVDGDTSIVGLMAQHGRGAATFWGQPYGSPLDAWAAAPFVAALGPTPLAVRLPYFLLALALVPLAWVLAWRLHPDAAAPAAFLAACPPAYLMLIAALPPPTYPTTLALLGVLLWGALALGARLDGDAALAPAVPLGLLLWGLGAGLALWTHLVAAAAVAPALVFLAGSARRRRPRLALFAFTALPALLVASAPWWLRLGHDPAATAVVSLTADDGATWRHLRALLPRLHEPLGGLIGAHAPTTADDPENHVGLPALGGLTLALLYILGLLRAVQAARRAWNAGGRHMAAAAALLGTVALLTVLAFPWPLRAGPETIRFLTPAWLPLAVLMAWAPAAEGHRRGAWLLALTLALLHLMPATRLLAVWRQSGPTLLPDCRPVLRLLDERGLRHAWASYDTAWCLTYLGGGRVTASQPWNERFFGHPLPYLDDVRGARDVAWVLVPGADFDLPSPERFEAHLRASGGTFRRTDVAHAVVYDRFAPPFPAAGRSAPELGAAGDGDVTTRAVEPGRGPTTFRLAAPQPLSAVTLVGGLEPPGLPRGFVVEASADGRTFERVARLRPGLGAKELVWANGHPQARHGLEVISLPLGGRRVAALRVTPVPEQGSWSLAELLWHPPAEAAPWTDAPPVADPRPERADWHLHWWLSSRSR